MPEAVRAGSHVKLLCDYDLEQAALYSIKWYRGEEEFYRYVPKESPPTRVFALPGVHVDVSYRPSAFPCLPKLEYELNALFISTFFLLRN